MAAGVTRADGVAAPAAGHGVTDFVWIGPRYLSAAELSVEADLAAAEDPIALARRLRGQFALHRAARGEHLLARDPLGVNKLFFAVGPAGDLVSSNRWIDLARAGHPARSIWSVPSGHLLRIAPEARELRLDKVAPLSFADEDGEPGPAHAARIRAALDEAFLRIRDAVAGRPLFVTLSGGLDSTTIAVLARRHLGEFTAVTFAARGGPGAEPSDDLRSARRVAAELRVPLRVVETTADELVDLLDVALCYGQDWRDFNVHCALVNAAIGRAIAGDRQVASPRPVVLTGDVMNELMADYAPVAYRGRDYYPLPRLPAGRLRRFLVGGLDAGDREVGVFAHYGIDVLQPYALCAAEYAAVPAGCLERPGAKQRLVRAVMGAAVPSWVYERPKVRAQVGGSGEVGGTLAACVDRGLDSTRVSRRFADLFGVDPTDLDRAIRAGFYRFPTCYADLQPSPHRS